MSNLQTLLSVELLRRIDSACDRFEAAWRAGSMPRVEDFLPLFRADERAPLLTALQSLQHELLLCQSLISDSETNVKTSAVPVVNEPDATDVYFQETEEGSESPIDVLQDGMSAYVKFRVIAGPHSGKGFTFNEHDTLFAGRRSKAQLRLEKDQHFSRHHFRLEVNPPTCFLMDLNSCNGTYVNGEKVRERFLRDGDIVSGGRTKMLVTVFDPQCSEPETAEETPNRAAAAENLTDGRPSASPRPMQPTSSPGVTTPANIETPLAITGYQIFEQIGAGDLGVVFRAQKMSTLECCALKVLSPAAHTDENSIQTFLREASVLNQLEHPHIIRIIEMGASGRNIFLATEYIKSIAWDRLVARYPAEKRIRLACGLMGQILSALEHAHSRSLVHRDVKPGNILIGRKDHKLAAKLSDFGLAKQYTTAGMSHVTRDGDVLGSLPFMSPDQFLNSRDARPTCDLYSAGATLYWMLTGREPIRLEGHPCKFLAILEDPPTPIRQLNPNVSEQLAAVVHRALEKTPEKRFASASEMRHQMKAALQ